MEPEPGSATFCPECASLLPPQEINMGQRCSSTGGITFEDVEVTFAAPSVVLLLPLPPPITDG